MDKYISQFIEKYSSVEATTVAEMAKAKGLVLLEGNYEGCTWDADYGSETGEKGYGVAKIVAGHYLTLNDSSDNVYQDYIYDGPFMHEVVKFNRTLHQARELIDNFNGTLKSYPNFFAYIRVYDGEPEFYGQLQMLYLEEFARRHNIVYKEKFVCIGGQQNVWLHPEDGTAIADVINCCGESFSKMDRNSYLVVANMSRLNDEWYIWRQMFDIIPVEFDGMDYTEYRYHESAELQKRKREYEKWTEDSEYMRMSQEHREMMMEQDDQPF